MDRLATWIYDVVASTKFFVGTLLLLIIQSVWLAFTAIFPLPFDEYVHVGVIQLYARQWIPFIAQQPAGTGVFGDVTREPSFLYHYLMSFPYRFFDIFIDNQTVLIVATRLLNVGFVVGALILFRKLLLTWGISKRITHVVLLMFVCTPIVPFLATHVNYDNLMLLLTPIFLLLATKLITHDKDLLRRGLLFVLVGLTTTLIKQTFLPLTIIVFGYVAFRVWQRHRGGVIKVLRKSWQATSKNLGFIAICVGLLLVGVLFTERYGGNVVTYGSIRPVCHEVQPREICEDFGPWYRDYVVNVRDRPTEPPYGNQLSFSQYWLTRMMRGYYAIFMHTPTKVVSEHEPYGPIELKTLLPLPISVGYVALVAGSGAVLLHWKRLCRNQYLRFGLIMCGFYLVVLWLFNYNSYLKIWKAEAIQARYTYPILIILFALMVQALNWTLEYLNTPKLRKGRTLAQLRVSLLLAFVAFYVWGGGIAGWLIRAEDTWRWQNPTVQTVNRKAQSVLKRFVAN